MKPGAGATVLTTLALVAFAGNSVLCRLALRGEAIDAASFTSVRVVSGAIVLLVILRFAARDAHPGHAVGSWLSAAMLCLYAVCFSFAYLSLDTGIGALILFGTVQGTMIGGALLAGDRPVLAEWCGWLFAAGGFAYLVSPGLAAPSPVSAVLMAAAGIGWGVYSLRGRAESRPLAATTFNFVRSVPVVLAVSVAALAHLELSATGVLLATASGAVTSGVGYTIWYTALRSITSLTAAMVQLAVPALAAAGGILFLSEPLTLRLVLSALLILGGILLAIFGRRVAASKSG